MLVSYPDSRSNYILSLKYNTLMSLCLNATFHTLLYYEESAGTSRTSIDHGRQTPGAWRRESVVTDTEHHLLSLAT